MNKTFWNVRKVIQKIILLAPLSIGEGLGGEANKYPFSEINSHMIELILLAQLKQYYDKDR